MDSVLRLGYFGAIDRYVNPEHAFAETRLGGAANLIHRNSHLLRGPLLGTCSRTRRVLPGSFQGADVLDLGCHRIRVLYDVVVEL